MSRYGWRKLVHFSCILILYLILKASFSKAGLFYNDLVRCFLGETVMTESNCLFYIQMYAGVPVLE